MARVRHSFTMDVPPGQAQTMFVRDLVPDLHRDAGYVLYEQRPGRLEFSAGAGDSAYDLTELTDPDVSGHSEEVEEPTLTMTESHERAPLFPLGGPRVGQPPEPESSILRRFIDRRLEVDFATAPAGTLVTLKGHAQREVRDALARLGSPGHWPATAGEPHD